MARIDNLSNFLSDVASAIRNKKGTTNTIVASNFDTEIESIEGGGKYAPRFISFYNYGGTELNDEITNLDISNMTSLTNMFSGCTSLTSLNVSNFDTSNITLMNNTFNSCSSLTSLNVSNFNTSNVISMDHMFAGCTSLTSLNVSNFDTSNVTNMTYMFFNCKRFTEIDLSNFTTEKLLYAGNMFQNCTNLKSINLSGFTSNPNSSISITNMFYNCTSLEHLDIRNWLCNKTTNYGNSFYGIPSDCEIIVKDDVQKNWILARRSDFTNVKTVAELQGVIK